MRRNAEQNREKILAAAEEVFGTQGVLGSTEEVAARAGVGIATVFRHFPTKDVLVEEALLRHFDYVHRTAVALAGHPDPATALSELLAVMIGGGGSKLTLVGLLGDPRTPPQRVRDASVALHEQVGTVLGRAQAAGAADPDVSVDELYFLLRGLAQAAAADSPPQRAVDHAVRIVQRGIAPGAPRA